MSNSYRSLASILAKWFEDYMTYNGMVANDKGEIVFAVPINYYLKFISKPTYNSYINHFLSSYGFHTRRVKGSIIVTKQL